MNTDLIYTYPILVLKKDLSSSLGINYFKLLLLDHLEGQLAASRWRSKFGRPSKVPTLGDVDPTGTFCPVPEDWLNKKVGMQIDRNYA